MLVKIEILGDLSEASRRQLDSVALCEYLVGRQYMGLGGGQDLKPYTLRTNGYLKDSQRFPNKKNQKIFPSPKTHSKPLKSETMNQRETIINPKHCKVIPRYKKNLSIVPNSRFLCILDSSLCLNRDIINRICSFIYSIVHILSY